MKRQLFDLFLVLSICVGCNNNKSSKLEQTSPFSSLYITIPPSELDSILTNRKYPAAADALLIDMNGDTLYEGSLKHIKTRGNGTWSPNKKAFDIKFPNKQKFLNLNKSKSFVLLANALDGSHVRNAIAFDLAQLLKIPAPKYNYLSLYINGSYSGLYMITNKVKIGKHNLNIHDLEEDNKLMNCRRMKSFPLFSYGDTIFAHRKGASLEYTPDNITGGYLLDMGGASRREYYIKSLSGFTASNGDKVRIKSPKHASEKEVEYIADVYEKILNTLKNKENITEVIDVSSFAKYCLLQDILLNYDGGVGSFYMYKEKDNPLMYAGPAWDFDAAMNNIWVWGLSSQPNQEQIIKIITPNTIVDENLLSFMYANPQFKDSVLSLYDYSASEIFHDYLNSGRIEELVDQLRYDAERDNNLYKQRKDPSYDAAVERVVAFLNKRVDYFDWVLHANKDSCIIVTYNEENENREEHAVRTYILKKGETFCLPEPAYAFGIYNNTQIPTWYYTGTDIEFNNGTTLYDNCSIEIRWRKPTKWEVIQRRIKKKFRRIFM